MASNEQAWQDTRDLRSIANMSFPSDSMVWATAATRNATTWDHIDDHGMATIVKVMTGRKYWITMRPKMGSSNAVDMGSINAFIDGWDPANPTVGAFDHEGILLEAGDIL